LINGYLLLVYGLERKRSTDKKLVARTMFAILISLASTVINLSTLLILNGGMLLYSMVAQADYDRTRFGMPSVLLDRRCGQFSGLGLGHFG
jgi:hypothetical protein